MRIFTTINNSVCVLEENSWYYCRKFQKLWIWQSHPKICLSLYVKLSIFALYWNMYSVQWHLNFYYFIHFDLIVAVFNSILLHVPHFFPSFILYISSIFTVYVFFSRCIFYKRDTDFLGINSSCVVCVYFFFSFSSYNFHHFRSVRFRRCCCWVQSSCYDLS